jgi:hypothetical protein
MCHEILDPINPFHYTYNQPCPLKKWIAGSNKASIAHRNFNRYNKVNRISIWKQNFKKTYFKGTVSRDGS